MTKAAAGMMGVALLLRGLLPRGLLPMGLALVAILLCTAPPLTAQAADLVPRHAPVSGYDFADPSTQAMQQDDFANPGFLWITLGEEIWQQGDSQGSKACASCHGAVETLKGVATRYPQADPATGDMVNLEGQINRCRVRSGDAPLAYESDALLALTALVKLQSRGMPVDVRIDGANAPWFARGQEMYHRPRGQLDLSCADCHDENVGQMLRAERLSQGQSNGFPAYRLKWQSMGSLHRRFRGCNQNIRSAPYAAGSDAYLALELYVAWRGLGLPVETPAVRK